ncbi:hypothetical protein EYF80_023190 [Liparis tanakae]|uniref:Uncharacterized protein n=1 Tax=Liparis tanakae TaxID=230148 RepID=A0A4Z2HLF6_9TELE|nr:hypothetical protein EYF80_023190 [Liparis tanakae]
MSSHQISQCDGGFSNPEKYRDNVLKTSQARKHDTCVAGGDVPRREGTDAHRARSEWHMGHTTGAIAKGTVKGHSPLSERLGAHHTGLWVRRGHHRTLRGHQGTLWAKGIPRN